VDPAGVIFTARVVRTKSRDPIELSSEATARVTAGGLKYNARAASAKLPTSATLTKIFMAL
jgi:hypothetical protein